MNLFQGVYSRKRVLVTGHTGFKGSWLALWLNELGASVAGVSLSPDQTPNHWDLLALDGVDHRQDIRDPNALAKLMTEFKPDIVFHLAAQALVRRSYQDPIETWSTNVLGTANLLEACRQCPSVAAVVVITTDKCYENREWDWGYRESDSLGGHDPYSTSKACAELIVASYRRSFFSDGPLIATARAGNVIGGGDWSTDRLIPDVIRAISHSASLEIRSPDATRPWQHVLEPLSGYLLLGQKLIQNHGEAADAWNFGPHREGNQTVGTILTMMKESWADVNWRVSESPQPHEARLLYLDSTKACNRLGWRPVLNLHDALRMTTAWYEAWLHRREVVSRTQLVEYITLAKKANVIWAN